MNAPCNGTVKKRCDQRRGLLEYKYFQMDNICTRCGKEWDRAHVWAVCNKHPVIQCYCPGCAIIKTLEQQIEPTFPALEDIRPKKRARPKIMGSAGERIREWRQIGDANVRRRQEDQEQERIASISRSMSRANIATRARSSQRSNMQVENE